MKHNMNRILTTMALLVLTTMTTWAEQKVNVTITPANSGTVTYAISNGVCTLTAKPADGYYLTVDNLKAVATLDGGAVQSPRRRIDVVDGTPITVSHATGDDPSGETTYTLAMPADANLNVEVTAEFQSRTSIEGATVTVVVPEGGIIYNGAEQKPAIASVVLATGATLTSADYAVSGYANNINVGNNAEVTVTGKSKYKGSATGTFTIGKADFSMVTIGAIADQTFTGAEIKPAVTVTFNGKSVSEDEYNVAYSDNVSAGTAMVTLTSKDKNFSTAKTKTATFKINPAEATLSFDKTELRAAVNETPEWPVLSNPQGVNVAYTSSRPEVAEVDKDGLVTMKGTGTTIIKAAVNDPNYQGADASYKLIVTSKAYKLKINGQVVTEENRLQLFDKSVMFDGVATLTLTNAHISGIESGLDALEIYVIGDNFIESETAYAIWDMTGGEQSLYIYTDMTEPGRLELHSKTQVVSGFKEIDIKEPMTIIDPDYMEALNEADNMFAVLGTPMDPIVTANNKNTIVDYSVASSAGSGGVSDKTLTNVIVDNVLYTLDDKQEPGLNDDGYADGMLVINSVTNQEGLEEAIKLKPGSPEYANKFKGVTFMVPAGFGKISFTVLTKEGHALCVNVGGNDPLYYQSSDPEFFTRPYSCTSATYVYIYHADMSNISSAPAEGNHRIGPKASVSTGITGLSVSANCIDTPPGGKPNYVSFSRDDLMIPESGVGHIVVNNGDITDVDEDAFGALTGATSNAPERAAQNYDITYIDLRGTSITGKVFSREEGPFKGLPETTFVYLPAGNETTSPNMVVGSVCNEVQLGDKQHRFEVAEGGFTTSKASLNRPFTVGQKQPVYLPFDIQAPERYGTFYEFDSFTNGVVKMKKAATVEANKPYYLQRSEDGEGLIVEDGVTLKPLGSVEQSQFVGTYEPKIISGDCYTYDNYLRMFFQATSKRVSPFEAYLTNLNGQNEMLTTQWEGEPTAVRTVTAESGDEGKWYTLDGRLLQHQPVERGIYLKNGKKYIVK